MAKKMDNIIKSTCNNCKSSNMVNVTMLELYKQLPFPLNVYTYILILEEGSATYLHYGIFKNTKNILEAQEIALNLLLERLPPHPSRILDVGIGLATTCMKLIQNGHDVVGITPDPIQIIAAKKQFGDAINLIQSDLEHFDTNVDLFDLLLFHESSQYILPIDIFLKASQLLKSNGSLLILDEFLINEEKSHYKENLFSLKHTLSIANRFGFELIEDNDVSQPASLTLDYILHGLKKHHNALSLELGIPQTIINDLMLANQSYKAKYQNGTFGYHLLHFHKNNLPNYQLVPISQDNYVEMITLFKDVFGHQMSSVHWHWKYGEGRGDAVGVKNTKDVLVGHYGGIARQFFMYGELVNGVQLGDVMVSKTGKSGLTKHGPFFLLAATFFELFVGYGKKYLIAIGFPNERARRLPEHLGIYGNEVERMIEMSCDTQRATKKLWIETITFEQNQEDCQAVTQRLWQKMLSDFHQSIIGIRDWDYIKHRYVNHPDKHYDIVLVRNRFTKMSYGLLICRQDEKGYEVLDIIAPLTNIKILLNQVALLAQKKGISRLYWWISSNYQSYFHVDDAETNDLGIIIPFNTWTRGPSFEDMHKKIWLMSGDTDFR